MNEKVAGVHWDKRKVKWQSRISVNGKREHLGSFETYEEAVKARKEAEIEYSFVPRDKSINLKNKNDLTQSMLKRVIHYNPETGIFTRRSKTSDNVKIGDIAGSHHNCGYIQMSIGNKSYLAHRLAFLYMTGKFPEEHLQVDHINHIKDDNKWVNLRIVNQQGNSRNCSINKNNKTGCTGVYFGSGKEKWIAEIKVDGEKEHLGSFDNLDDAIAARKAAEIKYNFHQNHGKQINQIKEVI